LRYSPHLKTFHDTNYHDVGFVWMHSLYQGGHIITGSPSRDQDQEFEQKETRQSTISSNQGGGGGGGVLGAGGWVLGVIALVVASSVTYSE